MKWMIDEEVKKIVNSALDGGTKSRATISRWRIRKKFPKDLERRKIEEKLGVPFDVLYRDVDYDALIAKLENQIKGLKKMKIENRVYEEIKKEGLK